MWWPSPQSFDDLIVEDAENGFTLSAPDDTECGEWLAYWNQDEAHHEAFESAFTQILTDYVNKTLTEHGQTEAVTDEQNPNRIETEEICSGEFT